jgi:hypothetical protein
MTSSKSFSSRTVTTLKEIKIDEDELLQRFKPAEDLPERIAKLKLVFDDLSAAFLQFSEFLNEVVPENGMLGIIYKSNSIEALEIAQMWAEKATRTKY